MDAAGKFVAPVLVALAALAYLVAKVIEHKSGETRIAREVVDGKEVAITVSSKKLDLEDFRWGCGAVALITFIWTLDVYGVFS